jgi:hypothetical protein
MKNLTNGDNFYNSEIIYQKDYAIDLYTNFINHIFDYHLEYIEYIYTDFKDRFAFSPFFLGNLKNTDLTEFIINLHPLSPIQNKITKQFTTTEYIFNEFKYYYHSEIYISYNIITTFLKQKSINLPLEYNTWILFCCNYSDLHELFKKDRL